MSLKGAAWRLIINFVALYCFSEVTNASAWDVTPDNRAACSFHIQETAVMYRVLREPD